MFAKNVLFAAVVLLGTAYLATKVIPNPEKVANDFDNSTDVESLRAVAVRIDNAFDSNWRERGIQSAHFAEPLQVARRLSLGLTGTIPSLEEIRKFEKISTDDQIDWWVNYLLSDDRFHDYAAERLARAFVGTENGPFILYRRRRFVSWLSDQLKENRPYDQLARHIISDSGLWTDTPSVNYYTVTVSDDTKGQPDPIRLAARTTRAFLGLRIDCLQCHDDALGTMELGTPDAIRTGTQADFHQLAAGFTSVRQTAAGLQETREENDYKFTFLDEVSEEKVPFKVPFQQELLPEVGTRRERLATWMTNPQNKAFSRAIVNRVWAMMFGKSLVDPIDDIPLFGERPPGMDLLADDFIQNGYDLRRLIRIIAQTKAFRMAPVAEFEFTDQHESSFAVFPKTLLRPEQVVGAVVQASSLSTIDDDSNVFQKLIKFGDINEFITRYGDSGEDEFRTRGGTIQQKNIMMNGKVVGERTTANDLLLNAASQINAFAQDDQLAIEMIFLTILTRRPTDVEADFLGTLFSQTALQNGDQMDDEHLGLDRKSIVEDVMWTLFNKEEFQKNH